MSYKIRVKRHDQIGGYTNTNQRISILPEVYEVELNDDGDFIFKGADKRNGSDLVVLRNEYIDLTDFPEIMENKLFELVE